MPVVQVSLTNHNDVILFQLNCLDRGSTEIWRRQQRHTLHRRCQHNSDTNHFPDVRHLHHLVKRQEPLHQIKQDVTSFEKTNIYNLLSLLKNWSSYFSTSSVMRLWWWTSAATNRGETWWNNNWTHCNKQGEQWHCDSHRDSQEPLWCPWWLI